MRKKKLSFGDKRDALQILSEAFSLSEQKKRISSSSQKPSRGRVAELGKKHAESYVLLAKEGETEPSLYEEPLTTNIGDKLKEALHNVFPSKQDAPENAVPPDNIREPKIIHEEVVKEAPESTYDRLRNEYEIFKKNGFIPIFDKEDYEQAVVNLRTAQISKNEDDIKRNKEIITRIEQKASVLKSVLEQKLAAANTETKQRENSTDIQLPKENSLEKKVQETSNNQDVATKHSLEIQEPSIKTVSPFESSAAVKELEEELQDSTSPTSIIEKVAPKTVSTANESPKENTAVSPEPNREKKYDMNTITTENPSTAPKKEVYISDEERTAYAERLLDRMKKGVGTSLYQGQGVEPGYEDKWIRDWITRQSADHHVSPSTQQEIQKIGEQATKLFRERHQSEDGIPRTAPAKEPLASSVMETSPPVIEQPKAPPIKTKEESAAPDQSLKTSKPPAPLNTISEKNEDTPAGTTEEQLSALRGARRHLVQAQKNNDKPAIALWQKTINNTEAEIDSKNSSPETASTSNKTEITPTKPTAKEVSLITQDNSQVPEEQVVMPSTETSKDSLEKLATEQAPPKQSAETPAETTFKSEFGKSYIDFLHKHNIDTTAKAIQDEINQLSDSETQQESPLYREQLIRVLRILEHKEEKEQRVIEQPSVAETPAETNNVKEIEVLPVENKDARQKQVPPKEALDEDRTDKYGATHEQTPALQLSTAVQEAFNGFPVSLSGLESIPEINELNEAELKFLRQDISHMIAAHLHREAHDRYDKELKNKNWGTKFWQKRENAINAKAYQVNKKKQEDYSQLAKSSVLTHAMSVRWQKATKAFQIAKQKKNVLENLRETGLTSYTDLITQRVHAIRQGPEIHIQGEDFEIDYINRSDLASVFEALPDHKKIQLRADIVAYNHAAHTLESMPTSWATDRKSNKHHTVYARANTAFETARNKILGTTKNVELPLLLANAEYVMRNNQSLTTFPNVERYLYKVENDSALWQAWKDTISERGAITVGSVFARNITSSLLGYAAFPIASAALLAVYTGRERGKATLREEQYKKEAGLIEANGMYKKSSVLTAGFAHLFEDIETAPNDKDRTKALTHLQRLVNLSDERMKRGFITFHDPKTNRPEAVERYEFSENLGKAHALLATSNPKNKQFKKTKKRVDQLMEGWQTKMTEREQKTLQKHMWQAIWINAGFALGGIALRAIYEQFGNAGTGSEVTPTKLTQTISEPKHTSTQPAIRNALPMEQLSDNNSPIPTSPPDSSTEIYQYNPVGKRDPFEVPTLKISETAKTDLTTIPATEETAQEIVKRINVSVIRDGENVWTATRRFIDSENLTQKEWSEAWKNSSDIHNTDLVRPGTFVEYNAGEKKFIVEQGLADKEPTSYAVQGVKVPEPPKISSETTVEITKTEGITILKETIDGSRTSLEHAIKTPKKFTDAFEKNNLYNQDIAIGDIQKNVSKLRNLGEDMFHDEITKSEKLMSQLLGNESYLEHQDQWMRLQTQWQKDLPITQDEFKGMLEWNVDDFRTMKKSLVSGNPIGSSIARKLMKAVTEQGDGILKLLNGISGRIPIDISGKTSLGDALRNTIT